MEAQALENVIRNAYTDTKPYTEVKIKLEHENALVPKYATDGAGCFDLFAATGVECRPDGIVETGVSFEIPEGHVMLVFSRSGHGFKNNVRLGNCVGVIDSDYRGTVKVKLRRDDLGEFKVMIGDRVAQAVILPFPRIKFMTAKALSQTERGNAGFGSTGGNSHE